MVTLRRYTRGSCSAHFKVQLMRIIPSGGCRGRYPRGQMNRHGPGQRPMPVHRHDWRLRVAGTDRSQAMAKGEAPVLEALADINAVSLERTELPPASLILVRLAALAAIDAPPSSYLVHLGPATEAGVTLEQAQDVLVAVAPIVGTPR